MKQFIKDVREHRIVAGFKSLFRRSILDHVWTIGFVVFVLCLLVANDINNDQQIERVRKAAFVVCSTSNALRNTLNNRGESVRISSMQEVREHEDEAKIAKAKGDLVSAKKNLKEAAQFRATIEAYVPVPLINCNRSYQTGRTIYQPIP